MTTRFYCIVLLAVAWMFAGCANITAPTGGKKDKTPPKLLSVEPADSLLNTRVKRIELHFDEYITVSDAAKEVQISPILTVAPTVSGINKHVIVKIVDTLEEDNTTYRISFNNAIKDLHEGNVFANYTYTFSTGGYFDSLQLRGTVIDATTGLPGMEGTVVELYSAKESDSAVVRHKPKYVTKPDASGNFTFKGLPRRVFRLYAVKDANDNLIYDGPGVKEMIGFVDNTVIPGDTAQRPISIKVFAEIPDTVVSKSMDSLAQRKEKTGMKSKSATPAGITYSVAVDTSNVERRTYDVNDPIKITFNRLPVFNKDKITLSYDSLGVTLQAPVSPTIDSVKHILNISPQRWAEDKVYTLRLAKGFAKDTSGADIVPSRYTFRTMDEEDDYGMVTMHVPPKYVGAMYLFRVLANGDSVYQKPISDTTIVLHRLKPAKYNFRIIIDKNHNGKWDTGDLFNKIQPEDVVSYPEQINVRAGFTYEQNFEITPSRTLSNSKDAGPPKGK